MTTNLPKKDFTHSPAMLYDLTVITASSTLRSKKHPCLQRSGLVK
jgi:hypothetical protein